MNGIPAEIKTRLSVLDIVGETVALKRAGSAYKGLCPFHPEKTPSFIVSPERESWHCFGCGQGGDIFSFVMRRDGIEFREALGRLAERAGVELSERSAREDRRRQRLRKALETAVAWYREVLLQTHQAQPARAYLAERGFSAETLERFGIGFAPAGRDSLARRLIAKGFTNQELTDAGLAGISPRGGGLYDRFRARIIIPIRDASGHPAGLGGRILPGTEGPKYLNSPATPLFDKSRTLFAIDLAKASIRREKLAVIVEGYTDVMAAHQAGFANVVASLGTALTRGQIELATRYADAVALAYDVDLAGETATQRGLLEELGPDQSVSKVRVVRIAAGKDPDELIRSDPDAWRRAVADAKPVIEYFMARAAAEVDLASVAGRREMTGRVLALLRRVGDPIERTLYLQQLARLVGVEERTLAEALAHNRVVRRDTRRAAPAPTPPAEAPTLDALERQSLELLLAEPTLVAEFGEEDELLFADSTARSLAAAWRRETDEHPDRDLAARREAFPAELDPATAALARALLAEVADDERRPALDSQAAAEALRVCLLRLRGRRIEESLRDGRVLLEEAQRDGDRARLEEIEQRINQLGRDKAEVNRAMRTPVLSAGTRRM